MTGPWSDWIAMLDAAQVPLLEAAAACDPADVAQVARLRREHPSDLIAVALQLAEARRKARTKFPEQAHRLMADPQAVEQATDWVTACHKADRIAAQLQPNEPILDLCSGMGGDAMAMTARHLRVRAVDHDPRRAWMTARNAACPAVAADVTTLDLRNRVCHIDPSRRAAGRRLMRLEDYQPGPDFLTQLIDHCPDCAIKLGPGIDRDHPLTQRGELAFVSLHGRLVQAVLWTGRYASSPRSSVLLPTGESLIGQPGQPPTRTLGANLYEPDPAAERAELLHLLCDRLDLGELHPGLGLLTGDVATGSPWVTGFGVLASMPWKERRLREALRSLDAGPVEIKTRGGVVDPDPLQRRLRGRGSQPLTVFILRLGSSLHAIVTSRLRSPSV